MDLNNTGMKSLLTLIIFALLFLEVKAQTRVNLFRQSATQKKYLLQQIAALHMYIGYAKKGYSIAKQGLVTISDIKHGEFNLHKDYFNSVKTVNPTVKKYGKIADIIRLQVNIVNVYREAAKPVKQSDSFNGEEIRYISGVFERLMDDCTQTIEDLIDVTTSGVLEMKDDQRLKRIDALYSEMQDKYTFVKHFSNEAKLLAASRKREQNDIQASRAVNGIKN